MPDNNSLLQFDQEHVWHPYASIPSPVKSLLVESAKGCVLSLQDGSKLIDGMGSWWAMIHGYNHPLLNQAIKAQIDKMAHVMFGGLTHQPAIELCQLLVKLTAPELKKVFLADSGSVAVEVAMKMAIQYWRSLRQPQLKKNKFLTVKGGYHGDTLNAMSVCDPENGMHQIFSNFVPQQLFADTPLSSNKAQWKNSPSDSSDINSLKCAFELHQHEIAAVILEPVCQGAGGMRFYSPNYLIKLKHLCDKYNILLIFDEIATGFGRTGKMFAYQHTESHGKLVVPDILCLGKALTGGYMSLAAVLTTPHISDTISQGPVKAFMHGPTFMGNPMACAVAVQSIKLLLASNWEQKIAHIEKRLDKLLTPLSSHSSVEEIRVLGAIGVVELKQTVNIQTATDYFKSQGVWLRPFGKLIYMMPPYCITDVELDTLCAAISGYIDR